MPGRVHLHALAWPVVRLPGLRPVREALRRRRQRESPHHAMDPGGFLACHAHRFLVVLVSKNATTSLKRIVHEADVGEAPRRVHRAIGYELGGPHRYALSDPRLAALDGYVRFAVHRDPVARLASLYVRHVGPDGERRHDYYRWLGLFGVPAAEFLRFVEYELRKPARRQDEHVRPASATYSPADVDHIVPIEHLDAFLERVCGVPPSPRSNTSSATPDVFTAAQQAFVRELYRDDVALLDSPKSWRPPPA